MCNISNDRTVINCGAHTVRIIELPVLLFIELSLEVYIKLNYHKIKLNRKYFHFLSSDNLYFY